MTCKGREVQSGGASRLQLLKAGDLWMTAARLRCRAAGSPA